MSKNIRKNTYEELLRFKTTHLIPTSVAQILKLGRPSDYSLVSMESNKQLCCTLCTLSIYCFFSSPPQSCRLWFFSIETYRCKIPCWQKKGCGPFFIHSPNMNTMVLTRVRTPTPLLPALAWELSSVLAVIFEGRPWEQLSAWEIMVRLRVARNISRLDVYSRAFRPALSIRQAAVTTDRRRTAPTRAASYLTVTKIWSGVFWGGGVVFFLDLCWPIIKESRCRTNRFPTLPPGPHCF